MTGKSIFRIRQSYTREMVNLRGVGAVLGQFSLRIPTICGFNLGFIAVGGIYISTIDDHWMVSVPNTAMGTAMVFEMHQGLWKQVSWDSMLIENLCKTTVYKHYMKSISDFLYKAHKAYVL